MKTSAELLETMLLNRPFAEVEKAGHLWQFRFGDGDVSLNTECPWRLLAHGVVAFGGDDDGQLLGFPTPLDGIQKTRQLLASSPVTLVEVWEVCSDLSLTFQNGVRLEAFNGSCGYEGWTCSGTMGTVVAQGGGNLWAQRAD